MTDVGSVFDADGDQDGGDVLPFSRRVVGDPSWRYVVDGEHAGLYEWRGGAGGRLVQVLDWCPIVAEHLVRLDDDGNTTERRYSIEVDGEQATVTSRELRDGDVWHDRLERAKGVGARRVREQLVNVVMQQAGDVGRTWMVRRTGWHVLPDGTWCYVRAAGDPVYHQQAPEPIEVDAVEHCTQSPEGTEPTGFLDPDSFDVRWFVAALRGDRNDDDALRYVRAAKTDLATAVAPYPLLLEAVAEGDRRYPDDPRRDPAYDDDDPYSPRRLIREADPDTMAALEALMPPEPVPAPAVRAVGLTAEIVRAAAPMERTAEPAEIEATLRAMGGGGWGPILGLSVGIRALAQSIVPVRSSLVMLGKPATGKSLTGWTAQLPLQAGRTPQGQLDCWPPVADASFSDAITGMEFKIDQAADRVVLIDDLALTAESATGAERDAADKFDRVTRAQANRVNIRDRSNRDVTGLREANRVRGIPVITGQRLPPHAQASALRRVVMAELEPGDNNIAWYQRHGESLCVPLRTIGDQVLALLAEAGPDGAASMVRSCDLTASDLLRPLVHDVVTPGDSPDLAEGFTGVVNAAAQMLGGLLMVGWACNVDTGPLLDVVVPRLAASLAKQADQMRDRQAADTGAGEALGEALRAALYARRAHIRDQRTDQPADVIDGLTRQAQGIRDIGMAGEAGEGVGIWWLEDQRALGIRSEDLHTLVHGPSQRDTRLASFTPRSLARYLEREGVTIPCPQSRTRATWQVTIGQANRRLVLIPLSVVFSDDDDPDDTTGGDEPRRQPGPPPPTASPTEPATRDAVDNCTQYQDDAFPAEPEADTADSTGHGAGAGQAGAELATEATQNRPEPPHAPPAEASNEPVAPATTPTRAAEPAPQRARPAPGTDGAARPSGEAERTLVLAVEDGGLVSTSGTLRARLNPEAARDLAGLLDAAARLAPAGRSLVLVLSPKAHKSYGLAKLAPALIRPTLPDALRPVVAAGWHRPGEPGTEPYPAKTVALERAGQRVRIVPVPWLDGGDFPRWAPTDGTKAPRTVELAGRLERFEKATGWAWQGSAGATAIRMLRDMIEAGTRRMPRWQASAGRWPDPVQYDVWTRDLTDEEQASATHVHGWDANRCYLDAYRQARVAADDLTYYRDPPPFDKKWAGYWRIVVPDLATLGPTPVPLPAPCSGVEPGRDAWVTTAIVETYTKVGLSPEVLEAWIAPRVEYTALRRFTETLRDLLAGDQLDNDTAVLAQVKALYQTLHGKLRSDRQSVIRRPDWGAAIRDAAWCNIVRKVWSAAGLMPLQDRITDGEHRYTASPAYPLSIRTDEVAYPGGVEAVAPDGIEVGDGGGRFKLHRTLTVADWQDQTRGR